MALNLFLTNHIGSNKFPVIITVSFFIVLLYVAFTYHNIWFEYDGIYFLGVGKEVIARKVILKEYTNRITRQSIRITGNQSLLESHQHTEQKGAIDTLKSLFSGGK